jgi:small nuclear ribonucleoprotein (snRNP)-like protein
MSTVAARKFFEELNALLQKTITVTTIAGKTYVGSLVGYNPDTMSLCLADTKDESGNLLRRLFLNGSIIAQIYATEKLFDLQALADRLEKVFPTMVKLYEEAGVIVVMNKIRVSEKGIIEGKGPAAERVQKVYDEFVREQA